jgi:hypothetical protein
MKLSFENVNRKTNVTLRSQQVRSKILRNNEITQQVSEFRLWVFQTQFRTKRSYKIKIINCMYGTIRKTLQWRKRKDRTDRLNYTKRWQ